MKIRITFEDVIEVEDMDQAYDYWFEYMHRCVKVEDCEAFTFENVTSTYKEEDMPNWCENVVRISGDKEEIARFRSETDDMDFKKILPY